MNAKTHEQTQERIQVGPQPGAQTLFMMAPETEVFFGGEAGGGKSFALVVDAMRYIHYGDYKAIIFRRTKDDLSDLIALAQEIYGPCGGKLSGTTFVFKSGTTIKFDSIYHIKDIYKHQGKYYDYIAFDELPQFPKLAYTYLFSRLRGGGMKGANPNIVRYMRGTGNPDGEGVLWVKSRFVDSMPMNTCCYFKTVNDRDTRVDRGTELAISRKFIPCIRSENRALMDNDPEY